MSHWNRVCLALTQTCISFTRAAASLSHTSGADLRPKDKAHQCRRSDSGVFSKLQEAQRPSSLSFALTRP